jgi:hypothetical protein
VPRVLVLDEAGFDPAWPYPDIPDHYGYGINHFATRGYEAVRPAAAGRGPLRRLDAAVARRGGRRVVGDIAAQWAALAGRRAIDLVYCPAGPQRVAALAALRTTRLARLPLVVLAHHPLPATASRARRRLVRSVLRGCSAVGALASATATDVDALAGRPLATVLRLGPDAGFYPSCDDTGEGVVAAGKHFRDFVTFGLAATRAELPATILCPRDAVVPAFRLFGDTVTVVTPPAGQAMLPLAELLPPLSAARALAIPLRPRRELVGMWSLLDALGLGKPVLVTRHPLFDLDVEAEGIGRFIDPGDVDGWSAALRFVADRPDEVRGMGRRARALVDAGRDSRGFADQVMDLFDGVLGVDTGVGAARHR